MWWICYVAVAVRMHQPVSQNLRQRISGDSSKLGKVAESLLGVQNDINRVEKEVMGKVFDLQTVRQFFSTHKALQVDRDELAEKNGKLEHSVDDLSEQVAHEKSEAQTQQLHSSAELAEQASKITELQTQVKTLETELTKRKAIETDKATLQHLNQVLRDELTQTTTMEEDLRHKVIAAQKIIQEHKEEEQKLSLELVKQHNYGEQCHAQLSLMGQRLSALAQEEHARFTAAKASSDHSLATAAEAQRQLMLEKHALEQKVASLQTTVATQGTHIDALNGKLEAAGASLTSVREQAKNQVQQLKFQEGALRTQLKTCDESLMQNVEARNMAEKQLHELREKDVGGREQMLEMKLAQCTDFQKKVSAALNTAQIQLATCTANKDQAINAREAAEKQLTILKETLRKTSEEAQAQVVAKTQEAAKYQEQAEKAIMEAEAQLSAKCSVVWRKKNKKVQKQLKACKVTKEDLRMSQAQTLTLEESLKACMQTK